MIRSLKAPAREEAAVPIVGPYVLSGEPLSGGNARLYKAVDSNNVEKVVAVKLFDPLIHVESNVLRASWTNELETYQRLGTSPYLVDLLDWGRAEDGAPYLVFEWLDGDLMHHISSRPLEGWDDYWPIARDVLGGLELIHNAGYVHRDLKPENVLIGEDGVFKIADFGTTRLAEAMRPGVTMALHGTVPYAPPEIGTPGPSPAYDLFSFAVMTVVCLTGNIPGPSELSDALNSLDIPPDIREALLPCLSLDVSERPESAGILLANLRELQEARESRRNPTRDLFIHIPQSTLAQAAELLQRSSNGLEQFLVEDLQAVTAFHYTPRQDPPKLQACGQTLIFRLDVDHNNPALLRVLRVMRPSSQTLDIAHATWLRPKIRLRRRLPNNTQAAAQRLQDFLVEVSEFDAELSAQQATKTATGEFATWRELLQAKFALEDQRASPIRYTSWRRSGARVHFKVGSLKDVVAGENRLVFRGRQRVLFGEVEQIDNGELILYVTRGDVTQIPKSGTLDFDAEASKSKLRRELAALDRLASGRAVRPPLRDLLLDPSLASFPDPVNVASFKHSSLDAPKRHAVATALGAPDMLLVQGPPGTGKTTFISELIAQELKRNPSARILLTAQTHVAVDHALASITRLAPDTSIVRIGRQDQIAEDVEELGLSSQLERLRDQVTESGRAFLRRLAADLGLAVDVVDTEAMVAELEVKVQRLSEVRSRLALKRGERKSISQKLASQHQVATEVLTVAASVERAAAAASASELMDAANLFLSAGVNLASALDSGGRTGEQLVAVEQTISELSRQLANESGQESTARERLANAIQGDPDTAADALIAEAKSRKAAIDDPFYNRLTDLAAEWAERFGKGVEFNAVVIAGSSVIGATCVGLTGTRGADTVDFDLCIVDEASKATATEALVPLVQSRRWILVGDEKQLPPFIEESLNNRDFLDRHGLTREAVSQTLFAELAEGLPKACVVSLTHQHRMHPGIGDLISECFYDGNLTSTPRDVDRGIQLALGSPVVWFNTEQHQDRHEVASGKSFLNPCEARVAGDVLRRLNFVSEKSGRKLKVAILSGYDPQRREMLDFVNRHGSELQNIDAHVANVDAYQGQEADVAIFMITRSNTQGDFGFLRQEPRINVALSRGRDALVIVGDAPFVRSAPSSQTPLSRVLQYIERSPEFCTMRSEVS